MHVSLAGFVLFLHITVAIAAFAIAGVLHLAFHVMPRVATSGELRLWARLMHRLEPLLPIAGLLLLVLGAWLVHLGSKTDDAFSYKDGWIITSVVTLVVVEALSGALLAPRTKALGHAIEEASDGPVPAEIRARLANPFVWHIGHIATFAFIGVVFLMTTKPSGAWAPVFPVLGAIVGMLIALPQLRAAQRLSAAGGTLPAPRTPKGKAPAGR
jgi:hypothetical protein